MPQLVHGDTVIVGYDPEAIDALVLAHAAEGADTPTGDHRPVGSRAGRAVPPGNSLEADQRQQVADAGSSLDAGLQALLDRIRAELDWNDVRGDGPYRLGMHDGLRFAEDAVVNLLRRHGRGTTAAGERDVDA